MRIRINRIIVIFICILSASICFAKDYNAENGKASHKSMSNEHKIQMLLDVNEIINVMSKHAYYHQRGQHEEEWEDIWVKKTKNPVFAQNQGYWVGYDKIYSYYVTYHKKMWADTLSQVYGVLGVANDPSNYGIGELIMHPLTTPVIEVAGDGKTAKAVWYSPGQVTQFMGTTAQASWIWERYGVDFVKEDGQWKIWHLHMYTDFMSDPTKSWADSNGAPPSPGGGSDDPTTPTISENTFNLYSKTQLPQDLPKVPEPYWTFSETFSYGPEGY